jgi:KaiC/GvpD/RAD55 family RecA-like ATPase
MSRLVLSELKLDELWERWLDVASDRYSFARLEPPGESAGTSSKVSFLVDGLVQRGAISLVVAAAGTGKSTGLSELAASVAANQEERTWLGQRINYDEGRRLVIYLAGEDAADMVDFWRAKYEDTSRRLISYPQDERSFSEIVELIERMRNVALVIVDPARYYLAGGEMSDDKVNEFLLLVARLARNTGAAVVMTHHLTKDAQPKSLEDFKSMMRGLQLWIDRARMVIGMRRRNDQVVVGVVKHNVPPQFPIMPERVFRLDGESLRLVPVGKPGIAPAVSSADQLRVLQEIRALNGASQPVFKSGKRGAHALAGDRLAGLSRDTVISIIDDLLALGAVTTEGDGALICAVPDVPAERSVMPEGSGMNIGRDS